MASMSVDDAIEHFGVGRFQIEYLITLGVNQCVDGIELLAMALLAPLLQCAWGITPSQGALITTMVFVGMAFGTPILSNLADRYGRKPILLVACSIALVFGILSIFSPTLYWFYFLRSMVGFGVAGILTIASTLLSEVSPRAFRAKAQAIIFSLWSVGSLILVGLAALVAPIFGWRVFLFFVSLPLIFGILPLFCNDESPRFLILTQQYDKAIAVFRKLSAKNKVPMPECPIDFRKASAVSEAGSVRTLFHKEYRVITVMLTLIWLTGGLMYYGAVLLSATLPTISHRCLQDSSTMSSIEGDGETDASCCPALNSAFYVSLAIAAVGDLASAIVDAYILDLFGRKIGLCICAVTAAVTFICLDFCMPFVARGIVMLLVRCFTLAYADGLYIFTLELYPTSIRSTALGFSMIFARIGGVITPFFAQVLIHYNARLTFFLYMTISIVGACVTFLIPKETVNAGLSENINDQLPDASESDELTVNGSAKDYNSVELAAKYK